MRECEQCKVDISHKRRDARFCSRSCKTKKWYVDQREDEEWVARHRAKDAERYLREAEHRREYARAQYDRNREAYVERSRAYRREYPERRRRAHDRRAEWIRSHPDYRHFPDSEWRALVNRLGGRCAYCNERRDDLQRDHVIPLKRGGRHAIANILPACPPCNGSKNDSLLVEWRRRLRERG
ncbi:HNH endonuclease signature motif containing protein [Nocardioides alkalitolerans]|uniref:HNH endonuclease n=1 Tax=Nocardioides alkalitolerans TaxID=281714 RepID=UPI00146F9919